MIMALPKLTVPYYDVVCPSGLKVTFRPFLVKEEKLLMVAMQSGDDETIIKTAKEILDNCVGSISNISIDKLPLFDVEFLFLQLRARSIGEIVKLRYKCNGQFESVDANGVSSVASCGATSEYDVNLLEIVPKFKEGHNKNVAVTPDVIVTLRYPNFSSFQTVARKDLPPDEAFEFLLDCIESISDKTNTVYTQDVPRSELEEFVNTLNHEQIAKLDNFFLTMPKVETTVHFNCPKCKATEDIKVHGLESFFD